MAARVRIAFDDLGKRFDARVVFRGVTGEARPGEVLLVTGPNGAGKSTLVQVLCGLVRPTRGTVRYLDEEDEMARERWRTLVGVVAPAMAVYEELTALENLSFFARVRGMGPAVARCRECLLLVGLDPQRTTPVRGFSTGMQQRLKIAQALLHDPPVLLLDEPGSNLDPSGQDWLENLVGESARAGKTIVLATNDRQEMGWGDRGVALPG